MFQPKWWKKDRDLVEDDVVFFQKKESALDESWTLGRVDQLIKGRDGLIRRVIVRYQNSSEDFKRITDRHIRSLVKLFSLEDHCVDEDLAELQRRLEVSGKGSWIRTQILQYRLTGKQSAISRLSRDTDGAGCLSCCCSNHCLLGHSAWSGMDGSWCDASSHGQVWSVGHWSLLGQSEDDLQVESEASSDLDESCSCSLAAVLTSLMLDLH